VAEAAVAGYETTTWFGVMLPRGTSTQIVDNLHAAFVQVLNAPDIRERVLTQGFEVVGSSPREFAAFVQAEIAKWAAGVRSSGAKVD
jgi:tripartite-type tricarboxylate transporter receptor subunit TctC